MKKIYYNGIPSARDYTEALSSKQFLELQAYSGKFLQENESALKDYISRWVGDPLHQWSRQWEYPFVYSNVSKKVEDNGNSLILDAGSGVTFFSFFLNAKFKSADVYCCDYDQKLSAVYDEINNRQDSKVNFTASDLRCLPYEKDQFDLIYCISVLEHTDNFESIIDEFYRVIKPGGELVVTFDVSLDGSREIDIDKSINLLNALAKRFSLDGHILNNLDSRFLDSNNFTTLTARDINPRLLPWVGPSVLHRIKSYVKSGKFGSWPPPMTVFCISLTKSTDRE
ncbi:bifunctional 2-polyprenyl-6-hydroxyphenol methylase/3-demethylubiquinol 3-O-methyltransferase UbiG [Saccharospirillum sp. MSK14-1]|uniref:class I SAM-dependent methyltransferase n=1 Tax=Saccharospirillum sp. MSK14-1 TaxID=1897632 RepID=UPI00130506C4|nr:methyltransferase domain-containing protein [Saccharospirillum sp. MSK14-1]